MTFVALLRTPVQRGPSWHHQSIGFVGVCAMANVNVDRVYSAEDTSREESGASSAASAAPETAPTAMNSTGESSTAVWNQQSLLLQKIRDLVDTQRALKMQKKQCAMEIKNALKRKTRLQSKASQLSDSDLVEVLRMRKAKKDSVQQDAHKPPAGDSQPGP